MTTLYEGAYAKINLTLDVLGKRPDGYHDIKSVMQTISLRDDIQIDLGTEKPWCIVCDKEGVPTDESNLCWKAAKMFFETVKKDPDGLTITITKRIPMQAGLGGGSADAAAVLRALNRHYNAPLSLPALAELGSAVGSDVPFCICGGSAIAKGRGEIIVSLPDMPETIVVLAKLRNLDVSTAWVYKNYNPGRVVNNPSIEQIAEELSKGGKAIAPYMGNVLETVTIPANPQIASIKAAMLSAGAYYSMMSGSGPTVFALRSTAEERKEKSETKYFMTVPSFQI